MVCEMRRWGECLVPHSRNLNKEAKCAFLLGKLVYHATCFQVNFTKKWTRHSNFLPFFERICRKRGTLYQAEVGDVVFICGDATLAGSMRGARRTTHKYRIWCSRCLFFVRREMELEYTSMAASVERRMSQQSSTEDGSGSGGPPEGATSVCCPICDVTEMQADKGNVCVECERFVCHSCGSFEMSQNTKVSSARRLLGGYRVPHQTLNELSPNLCTTGANICFALSTVEIKPYTFGMKPADQILDPGLALVRCLCHWMCRGLHPGSASMQTTVLVHPR